MRNLNNEQLIREFISAWSRLDVEELISFFTDDGVYHNMPIAPVAGHETLWSFITAFVDGWTQTKWDILNIASCDNIVFVERLDRTKLTGRAIDLPCCGVFEVENGRIRVWRDYFDMATYVKGAQG